MTAGTEYANKLEQWFLSTPEQVQQVLRPVFDPANDMVKAVAGDPQDLVRAGQRYVDLSRQIAAVAEAQRIDRGQLTGAWEGAGFESFMGRAADIEARLEQIGEATGSTQEVLEAAAQTCVDGANLIIDIVVALIAFAIGTLVVKLALAALTFGATMVAWVAEQVAAGLVALARIMQVVAKVAEVLRKVADIFKRLGETLRGLAALFTEIRLLLVQLDQLAKAAKAAHGATSAAHGAAFAARATGYAVTNAALLGGAVPLPGGALMDTAGTARDAVDSAGDIRDAAAQP